jgi:two-component system OmpR family sensor kinase
MPLPVRLRSALAAVVVGGCAAGVVAVLALSASASSARRDFDTQVSEEVGEIFRLMAGYHSVTQVALAEPGAGSTKRIGLYDSQGLFLGGTDPPPAWPEAGFTPGKATTVETADGQVWRSLAIPMTADSDSDLLVVSLSGEPLAAALRDVRLATAGFWALAVLAIGAGGYLLAGWTLGPIERLRRSADRLAASPEGRRLEVASTDEVGRLASTLNRALDQIEAHTESQRQFVAEASHELRTPLARLRADVEDARRAERSLSDVSTALDAIDTDIDHLVKLSDGLLALLGAGRSSSPMLPCTVESLLASVRRRMPDYPDLVVEAGAAATSAVECDLLQLAGAIANLVENAYVHGAPPVEITARLDAETVDLCVRDHGAGLDPEEMAKLTLPFARGLEAAGKKGSGLGLAIVAEVVRRHGGTLFVEDAAPGCRAIIRLPRRLET